MPASDTAEKIQIKSRWGGLLFECEVDASLPSLGLKIGAAVKIALKKNAVLSGADLSGAVLSGAVLSGAVLRSADLSGAVLRSAVLSGAVLSGAVLRSADLRNAVLRSAVLSGADLSGADLRNAVLSGADLSGADLRNADLRNAVLSGADLSGADLSPHAICPEEGAFIAFKKLRGGYVAKLEIPAEARRVSTPIGRKCRAEFAKVLEISGGQAEAHGMHDSRFVYRVGEIARPDSFDDDIRLECTHGIHFFVARAEAEAYE